MPADERPVITGVPDIVGLVNVLFVRVCVASRIVTVPEVLGKVIVLSAVGSTTVRVVSKASSVEPSNVILVATPGVPVIVGETKVLLERVCVSVVPTTELVDAIP